jgi:hypothetical protein
MSMHFSSDFHSDSMASTSFSQRKAGICAALAAQVNDKSPKGSLDAPIADLVNEVRDVVSVHCFRKTSILLMRC